MHQRVTLILICLVASGLTRAADPAPPVCDDIQTVMQEFVDHHQVSGVVTLVADRDQVLHLGAVGLSNLETERPMQTNDLFWIASLTKPFTATSVMILQDDGKLSIDDPVAKHLPNFAEMTVGEERQPAKTILTIRHLLTHTSGVAGVKWPVGGDTRSLDVQAYELASLPLQFEPGSQWKYGNGLNVAARIVEVVSGIPFDKFIRHRITEPLGMDDTTFRMTEDQYARFARNYEFNEEKTGLVPAEHKLVTPDPAAGADITPSPSGGLFSTARDLSRFYRMFLNAGELDGVRVLSPESVQAMTTLQTGDLTTGFTPGNGWGLGLCIVREPQGVTRMLSPGTFGHGGAYGSQAWSDPEQGLIYVLMIQRRDIGNSDASPMRDAFQSAAVTAFGVTQERKDRE